MANADSRRRAHFLKNSHGYCTFGSRYGELVTRLQTELSDQYFCICTIVRATNITDEELEIDHSRRTMQQISTTWTV